MGKLEGNTPLAEHIVDRLQTGKTKILRKRKDDLPGGTLLLATDRLGRGITSGELTDIIREAIAEWHAERMRAFEPPDPPGTFHLKPPQGGKKK